MKATQHVIWLDDVGRDQVVGIYWRQQIGTITQALARLAAGQASLAEVGKTIRQAFLQGDWPERTAKAIISAYAELCNRVGKTKADVAVRSSATAEDLPDASFARAESTRVLFH